MTDRTIKVVLKATTDQFDAAMKRASSSASGLAGEMRKAQGSEDWNRAATAIAGAGAATLGLSAAVAKTGIDYNTLQQQSRAALTAIFQSGAKANAQMDALDEFARTSPFSKGVFIQAQQQMLGFGIEAEKVIPYLTAINEAVAATGGNNHDISEISRIMSQISASAKITATDLREFGNRGIDAATLIGSQMGKTGAQIRDEITAGTLDADQALDALAAGMEQRFRGASEGVKNTMTGAVDRLKASWRDLSATVMESAVGPEGGGWLIDLTNGAADAIRAIEALPPELTQTVAALGALSGAGLAGAGGLMLVVPQAVATYDAMKRLETIAPKTATGIRTVGRAAGIAAIAITGLRALDLAIGYMRGAAPVAEELGTALERLADGTGDLNSVLADLGPLIPNSVGSIDDLGDALKSAATRSDPLAEGFNDVMSGLTGIQTTAQRARERFGELDAQLAAMDAETAADAFQELAAAAEAQDIPMSDLVELFPQYAAAVDQAASAQGLAKLEGDELTAAMSGLHPELDSAADASDDLGGAMEAAAEQAQAQTESIQEATEAIRGYYDSAISAIDAEIQLAAALDDATASVEENGATLDINTEAGRANKSALVDVAEAAWDQAEAMAQAGDSTSDVTAATEKARAGFVKTARQMGLNADEANALADELGLIPEDVATLVSQPGMGNAQTQARNLRGALDKIPASVRSNIKIGVDDSGYWEANRILNRINGRTVTANIAIKQYGQGAVATGGYGGHVADAVGLADGGMARQRFTGREVVGPGTPTSDDVPAWLSRREFVHQAAAVDYYGLNAMYALNSRRIPREAFAAYGFAGGGSPSAVPVAPAPQAAPLAAELRQALAGVSWTLDGRAIDVRLAEHDAQIAAGYRRQR